MNLSSYADFSRSVHQAADGQRFPLEVSIEVTRRCPLECLHCYNNLPMGDAHARRQELTVDEHRRLLDEIAEMGCVWLLFTGGEIFARKDFLEIYTYAKRKGFLITLFTNGTVITEKIADYLQQWPPFAIEITLYGRTKETYEKLTGISGSYERCLKGIRLLRDRGLPLKLKTVATTVNKHEVVGMRDFAQQELQLELKHDSLISPRIDCSQSPLNVRLSPQEVVALDFYSSRVVAEYRQMASREINSPAQLASDDSQEAATIYGCGGGIHAFAIDPYGRMSICVLSQRDTYDTRGGSVKRGWEQFLAMVRSRKRTRISKCEKCRLQALCSMCPANGELENGDAESPVDFLCEVAHLRALALGFQVPEHGSCEFCEPGTKHDALLSAAGRIASGQGSAREWEGSEPLLPILNNELHAASGCGGCGASFH
jgi:radical SAM protein with 4Fe4S-binding SPASM domain